MVGGSALAICRHAHMLRGCTCCTFVGMPGKVRAGRLKPCAASANQLFRRHACSNILVAVVRPSLCFLTSLIGVRSATNRRAQSRFSIGQPSSWYRSSPTPIGPIRSMMTARASRLRMRTTILLSSWDPRPTASMRFEPLSRRTSTTSSSIGSRAGVSIRRCGRSGGLSGCSKSGSPFASTASSRTRSTRHLSWNDPRPNVELKLTALALVAARKRAAFYMKRGSLTQTR